MNGVLQLAGFILNTVGLICVLATTFVPEWRRNDPSGEVLETIIRHQGIWVRCISYPTGQWQCDDYDSFFLGLPNQLQVARGLCISACIFCFIGFIISLVGMQCTNCIEDNPTMKSRISLIGAGCFGLAGLVIGAAVSYYAHQVLSEYNRDAILFRDDIGQRFIYGTCLFIGWAACAILVLGGVIAACGSLHGDDDDIRRAPYVPYKANTKRANTEYV